jgi:hypothetical protein
MPASGYVNPGRSPRPSVRRYSIEGEPVQVEKLRGAKAKLSVGVEKVLHYLDYGVKLAESIYCFMFSEFNWIGN